MQLCYYSFVIFSADVIESWLLGFIVPDHVGIL